jgi:hypothetical protein
MRLRGTVSEKDNHPPALLFILTVLADKSEQGQECAISHPLPTNPDGSPMSESQYKAYRMQQLKDKGIIRKLDPDEEANFV